MTVALILVSVALVIALYFLFFGPSAAAAAPATHADGTRANSAAEVDTRARQQAEAELDKKRRELDEVRTQMNELRGELKQAKRKLFDNKEAHKNDSDLVKARAEVERSASIQLESVRAEHASALAELAKLKAEQVGGKRRPVGATALVETTPLSAAPLEIPVVAASVPAPAPVAEEKPRRVIRELSEADKEKMDRLEHQANKDRTKAAELDKEVRRLKGRNETQHRIYTVTKSELDLVKDKFKALEKRLNRTLLERDLTKRAILDLAKKTGTEAERTELTADEIAQSDKSVDDRQRAEAAELERRTQAAKAVTENAEAAASTEPAAPGAAETPSPATSEPAEKRH